MERLHKRRLPPIEKPCVRRSEWLVGKRDTLNEAVLFAQLLVAACLLLAGSFAVAGNGGLISKEKLVTEQSLMGLWKEKGSSTTYAFLAGHDFELTWLVGLPRKGVWEFREGVCVYGQAKGNLAIYSDTQVCCLLARFLGRNLVISHIAGPPYRNECKSRILVRQESLRKIK